MNWFGSCVLTGLGLGLGFLAGPAHAQPAAPLAPASEVRRAAPVVVTATRSEELLEEIGASVTVIPEAVFRAHEHRTVEDALRTVPGLDVQRSGTLGKITSVRIRGANPSQIQVLIDGVRVKSVTSGDFDLADLPLDEVERIEVVRGPQSTLYGADAIGGVINVITRRGAGAPSAFLDLEAGNYETFRERLGVSGTGGPWRFSLGASRLDFGGQFGNDEHTLGSVSGRLARILPGGGEVALTGRYTDGHRGIPFRTTFPDFDDNREQDDRLALLSLEWRQPWTAFYEQRLRLSGVRSALTLRDPDNPFERRSDIETERGEVDWLHVLRLGRLDTITAGAEYRAERGTSKGVFSESSDSWAVFVQNELRLFERLFLTAGIRHDDTSAFGGETTGRAALSYLVRASDTRLKASWGQGFRAPTFNELFFPATFPPCPAFGNRALQPEESESWDAGVEQHLWGRRARLAATVFRNDFENLIQAALIDPANFCFQARNVGRARTQGVEVEASVAPIEGLLLSLAYTHTDTEDRATGQPLRRFAPNRLAVTAVYEPVPGLTLSGEVLVASSQFEGAGVPRNPGYTVVNAAASYRLPRRWWGAWRWLDDVVVHLRATNLFNEDYAEAAGFPALGTHVVAGVRAAFR